LRYCLIEQNLEYFDAPKVSDFHQKINKWSFYNDKSFEIPMRSVVNVLPNKNLDFVDYLFPSVPLITKRMREVIEKFESEFVIKEIILFDPESGLNELYYIPFFHRFESDVLQSPSWFEVQHGDFEKQISISPPFELPVFYVFHENTCLLFMRLDLIEALLRSGVRGLVLRNADVVCKEEK